MQTAIAFYGNQDPLLLQFCGMQVFYKAFRAQGLLVIYKLAWFIHSKHYHYNVCEILSILVVFLT